MKIINIPKPEEVNRDEDAALDSWDTASPPSRHDESEFTDHERALLDVWDKTNAPSPADDAQFEAHLLAVLDDKLDEPTGVASLTDHRVAELRVELACAQMAADARSDGTAPAPGMPGLIVVDSPARRACSWDAEPPGHALTPSLEGMFRGWRPDAWSDPATSSPRPRRDGLGMGVPGGTDRARSWLEAFAVEPAGDRPREPVPASKRLYELLLDTPLPVARPATRVAGCSRPIAPADHAEPRPARSRKPVVLMVTANPHRCSASRLSRECEAIQHALDKVPQCDGFHFESRWAVNLRDLTGHLAELAPTVLHIAGHGAGRSGLVLQDALGYERPVSARALTRMLETAARSVRIAVLNACFCQQQADALRRRVDCVVGTNAGVGDDAARMFACEFYAGLGNHQSVGNAFEHSVATLAAKQPRDEVQPHCVSRKGVDVRTFGLWDPGPAAVRQPRT